MAYSQGLVGAYLKQLYLLRLSLIITSLWALSTQFSFAQTTYTSTQSGNFNAATTWGGTVPGPTDNVIIQHTVTLTATATIAGVQVDPGGILRFTTGNLTLNGDMLLSGTGQVTVTGGVHTFNISGNFTNNSSAAGNYAAGTGGTRIDNVFNGIGAQAVGGSQATTFNNFTINTNSNVTLGTATTINRSLTINATSSLTVPVALSVNATTGTTSISGDLNITSASGTKAFIRAVTINAGGTFNNSGNSSVNFQNGITNNGTFTSGTGVYTFDTNNQSLAGSSGVSIASATISTITVTNNTTFTVGTALSGGGGLTQGLSTSVLNIGGTSGISTLTATAVGNTVNYTGASQTINGTATYHHLNLQGSGTKTFQSGTTAINGNLALTGTASGVTASNLTIAGTLNIGNGTTFTAAGFNLTVTGQTTVGGGTSGSLAFSSATGTKTFNGLVTVEPGASWLNNTANSPVTFHGGITNNGTFTAGTGVYTFDTNNQVINGTLDIPNTTITGVTVTNTNGLTVSTALSGSGGLTQGTGANLTIGGTSTITTLTASAAGNTVTYNGTAQTVKGVDYVNLVLSGSSTKTLQATTANVAGNFTMIGSVTTATVTNLTIGGNLSIGNGTFSAAGFSLLVSGTTTLATGGTLAITSAISTKTFNGLVTISSGAAFTNTANSNTSYHGGITNNGTFSAGTTSTYTFDTNPQSLTGTFTLPNVTVTGVNLTNNNSLSVLTALNGAGGTLTQAANASLDLGGTSGIATITASATGNTVTYSGSAQTVHSNNYVNLSLTGSGVKTLQGGTTNITGNFTIGGTASATAVNPLVIGGNLTLSGGTFVGGAFIHQLAGNWINNGGTFTSAGSTINFNGASQSIGGSAATTFNNVTTSGTSSTTTAVATTISGALTVGNTSTLTIGGYSFTVTGTTNVGSASAANLVIASGTGTKLFTGLVTVSSSAVWNNSGNSSVTFRGGITNSGAFTAGSGTYTFDTSAQALNGILSIPNVAVNGVVLTNNNDLTINNSLAGSGGTLTQAATGNLTLGGSVSIPSLNASAVGNTVNYNGSGQNVFATTYDNLNINQSAGQASLVGATTVNGTLTLSNGNLSIGSNNLLLGAAPVSVSSPSASKMIIASGSGEVRRTFTGAGSYVFPIGDNTGTLEYSPITVNYTAGTFSSAYVGVSVTDAKHPFNASTTNYLTRYWNIDQSGITGGTATISAQYPSSDINGTETLIKAAHLSGAFSQVSNPWTKYNALSANTFTISTPITIVAGTTSYCTGVNGSDPSVTVTGAPFTICNGGSVSLPANPTGGDGPYTYSWTPTAGLSATTVQSPSASPTSTTNYTVTVRDANGAVASGNANVNVNPVPTLSSSLTPTPICSGSTFAYNATSATGGATFTWTRAAVSGISEGASSGNGDVSETLTNISNVPVAVTYAYIVSAASCSSPAQNVVVYVIPVPSAALPANQDVCNGASTSVSFTGVATSYDWTNDNTSIGLGATGTGNISSFTATNAGSTSQVAHINVTPKYTYGVVTCAGPVKAFTITVEPSPTVAAVTSQEVCSGTNTTAINFSGGPAFSWTNDTSLIGLPSTGTGNIASFTAINNTGAAVVATIVVTPTAGSCTGSTTSFTITVNPAPGVNTIADQAACNGAATTAISFAGVATSYAWTNNAASIGLAASGTGNIASFSAVNNGTSPVVATIVVTPTFTGTTVCTGPTKTFTITVNPTPGVAVPVDQEICNGEGTASVNFSGTATQFNWTNDTPSIGLGGSGVGNISPFTATNATTSQVTATITVTPKYIFGGATCSGTPVSFSIAVDPTPTVTDPADQVVCNGASVSASFSTTGASDVSWTNSNTAIGLPASGTGNIGAFIATNTSNIPLVATITVTPLAGSCTGTTETFTITVNPTPMVNDPADQTVCAGGATTTVNFSGVATGYSWTNDTPSIGLGSSGTGDITAFVAVNGTSSPVVATITVTPEYTASCTGSAQTFTVTVYPTPSVTAPADQGVCNGTATSNVVFLGTASSYTWTNDTPSIGLPASGTGDIVGFTAINSTAADVVATISVTPHYGTCNGTVQTFTITVKPTPAVTAPANQVVCNGANTTAITFAGTSGSTFSWTNDTPSIGLASGSSGNIGAFAAVNAGTTPVTATITVTPTLNSCVGASQTFKITVNPTPSVTAPANQVVCNSANTAAINFSGTATSYDWTNDTGSIGLATSGTGNIAAFAATNSGSSPVIATITITPKYTFGAITCNGPTKTFTITVQPTPVVAATGSQVVCNGTSTTAVTFSGTATGYTWTNDNTSIGLAASGTGNIASFTGVNSGSTPAVANIVVTPVYGSCTGATKSFTITVNPTPSVTAPADQVVCNGANTTAVNFTGTGTSYDWTNDTGSIGLATSGTGNIAAFAATNSGSTPVIATITITPKYTFGAVTCNGPTKTFTITVQPTPVVTAIANQEICNGSSTTAVTFGGTATSFTWTNDTASIGLPASGTGNIAAFTGINSTGAPVTATIVVTPHYGTCTGATKSFTLTVDPTPNVTAIANQVVCNGANTTAITFTGTGTSYTWTNDNTSIGLAASGTGNIAAFAGLNTGTSPAVANITVTPVYTGAVTCNGPTKTFTITVNPTPSVTAPANQVVCNGANTAAVNFSGTATSYDWTNDTGSIGLATSGTGNIAAFAATNSGSTPVIATITITPKYTFGAVTCNGPTKTFTITVQPTPVVAAIGSQVVCNGTSTTGITFSGTATGYTWTNDNTSIGLAASGTGNIASFTGVNSGSTSAVANIVVTPVYGSCTGATKSFTITVNPTPSVTAPADQVVCNGANTTAVNFTGTGTSYDWTNDTGSIGLATSGTGNIAAFAATNSGSTPVIATITITPKYTFGAVTCNGPTKTFTITVQPTPVVTAIANQEICNGSSTTAVTFGGTSTSFTWTNDTASIGLPASGTGNIAAFTGINSTGAPVTATIVVTPHYGTCTGATKSFTITVDPTPNVTAIANQVVCNGANTTAITFTGTGTSYTWTNDNTTIGLAASGTGNIAAFAGINTGTSPAVANITVTPVYTGAVTCNGPTKTFTITVNPTPSVTAPSNQVVCNSANTAAINFSGTATSYDWTNDTGSIGLATSGTGNIAAFAATNSGSSPVIATITITPKYTFGAITCNGPTKTFTITVQPTPVVAAIGGQVVCNGTATTTVTFSGTATGYTWTNDNTSIGLAASGTGNIVSFTGLNSGSTPAVANIVVTPVYGSCTGATKSFTITVNPTPSVTAPADQVVCNGANTTAVNFTGTGTSYDWTNDTGSIGLATSGTGNIAAFAATNSGSTPVVATITITPKYTFGAVTCNGPTKTFTITVQPTPVVTAIANQEICNGSSTTAITFGGTATSFTWTNDTASIGLPASGTGNIAAFTGVNNGTSPVTATISVTPQYGSCNGAVKTFTIKVNPNPTFTATNNASNICSGASTNIAFASPTTGHRINVVSVSYGSVSGGTVVAGTTTFTNGNTLIEALTNNTTAPIDVVYTFNVTTPSTTPSCPVTPVNQVITVRVQPAAVFTATNNAPQICSGSNTNITLNTGVTGAQIRIQNVSYGAASGTLASGATFTNGQSITEVITNSTNSPVTVTYTFEAVVGACTPSATQMVQVIVNPNPSFAATNNAATICSGTATNIAFASPTTGHRINVVSVAYGSVAGGTVTAGTTTFVNGNSLTETLTNATNAAIDVVYVFNVTTPGTTPACPVATSNQSVTVRVMPAPTFSLTNGAAQICSGSQTSITLNTPVSGAQVRLKTVTYGAVSGTLTAGALYTNGQQITEVLTNNTNAPITVAYTFEAVVPGCTPSSTQTTNVVVNPNPAFTATNNNPTICNNSATNIAFASSTAGHRINVVSVSYGAVTGGTVVPGTTTFTNGTSLTETLANATTNAIDVVYVFNVTTPGTTPSCPLSTTNTSVTVRVQPAPSFTVTNNAPLFCSGSPTSIVLNTPVSGAQIRLANVNYGAVSGSLSSGALYTNGQQITEVLTNNTNAPVTVAYTFEAVVSGCTPSAQQVVNVVVDPIPALASNLSAQELCDGQTPTLVLSNPNNVSGTQYVWTISTTNVVGAANQPTPTSAGAINTVLSLSSGSSGTITYSVRAVANGCYSAPSSIQLTVRKQPTVSVPANITQCEPATIPLNGSIGGSATTALWSVISGAGPLSATNIVAGSPITANAVYSVDPADIAAAVTMRLTTNDPDGPSGLCTAISSDYVITIHRSAKVDAGPDLAQCQDVPSIALQGSSSYSPNGTQWSLASAAGTFSNAASLTSNYTYANPSEAGNTVTLRLTAFDPDGAGVNNPCTNVSDLMTVTINKLPVVSYVGFPPSMSLAENGATITLTGNQIGGLFTISPSTSVIGTTVPNPTDKVQFNPTIVSLGANTVTYTYTDAKGCTNFDSQVVQINPVTNVFVQLDSTASQVTTDVWAICGDHGLVKLIGDPPVTHGKSPFTRFIYLRDSAFRQTNPSDSIQTPRIGADHYINTEGAVSGTYWIRYYYRNEFDVDSYKDVKIILAASPIAVINVNNSCVKDVIQFNDASTLPNTPFSSSLVGWRWDFDDQSFSTFQNPPHAYVTPGYRNIVLTATSATKVTTTNTKLCSGTASKQIRVGDVPTIDYSFSAFCNNDKTKFVNGSDAGVSTITSYQWDFGDGTTINGAKNVPVTGSASTTGTFDNPEHLYSVAGTYTSKLTINTDDGCKNALAKSITIFEYVTVIPDANEGYMQNFSRKKSGWTAESLSIVERKDTDPNDSIRYSWLHSVPNGLNIVPLAGPTDSAFWTGRRLHYDWVKTDSAKANNPKYMNKTSYFTSETSAVNGPCFNLQNLPRPMMSLDYWSDAELNRDGTVLQYSIDGGATWQLIGPPPGVPNRDEGINWYNSQGIVGKPGNQDFGDYGWSGSTAGWKNARFNLDMIPYANRNQVRLRISFGSEDANSGAYDGFAFDNVFVGNKTRNVLVEHFTSADQGSLIGDQALNALYDDQVTRRAPAGGQSDFQDIQYHISSPVSDPLYKDNQVDPGARSVFMGVSAPPTTLMDGIRNSKFTGVYSQITAIEVDRRALVDPQIELKLDTATLVNIGGVTNVSNKIKPIVTLTARQAFTTPLLLNIALVEDVGSNRNVLRKLLFGPDGMTITNAIAKGETILRDKDIIDINAPVTNPAGLTMIAFIQDKNTKEIYQSISMKVGYKIGSVTVGLGEEPSEEAVITNKINVFPNPASGKFYFGLPADVNGDYYKWRMSDQRGVIVRESDFSSMINNELEVDISNLANGMYIVIIEGPDKSVAYHKVMVMNHH
ncbi:MAG: PKD-like domain-containing protein [Bacteroidota bacterium]